MRKEIHVPDYRDKHGMSNEAELLFLLGSLQHKNIVELLGSYTQLGISNLLFAPADSDLHSFLLLSSRASGYENDATIFKAFYGLSSGLAYLHNFRLRLRGSNDSNAMVLRGYHHDIKPRNVLVRGLDFILADFGLSALKSPEDDTKTIWKNTTFEYGAPECRDPETFAPNRVGQPLDIWSLSCIGSELMTYMVAGLDGISTFRDKRIIEHTYGRTSCFHDGVGLSSNVVGYLKDITEQTSLPMVPNFLSFSHTMFATSPTDRPSAAEVESHLLRLTIEVYLYMLLQKLEECVQDPLNAADTNVYQTRLYLEKNRLLAWATVLNLRMSPAYLTDQSYEASVLFPELYEILDAAVNKLSISHRFDATEDDHDFIISMFYHTNNQLCNKLSGNTRASIDSTFAILGTRTSELQTLQSIRLVTRDVAASQYEDVGAVAAMKYMAILLSETSTQCPTSTKIDPSLVRKDDCADDPEIRPQTYWYSYGHRPGEERKVLIEWKGYGTRWKTDINSKKFAQVGNAMFERIQELVMMLQRKPKPPEFRVLDCLGTFHDTHRQEFAILYETPSDNTMSIRLHKLLRLHKSQEIRPDPSQKLELAKALVASIQSLHIAGWVHKSLNSYNVLFFSNPSEEWKDLDFAKPYIVGFNHSRKDGLNEYTEGAECMNAQREYLHPEYRKESSVFRRHYEYYSLGLMLLEIGTWNSLSNIYKRFPRHSPVLLQQEYMKICNNELKTIMGPTYQAVTRKCLSSESEFSQDDSSTHLSFEKEVIQRLRSLCF